MAAEMTRPKKFRLVLGRLVMWIATLAIVSTAILGSGARAMLAQSVTPSATPVPPHPVDPVPDSIIIQRNMTPAALGPDQEGIIELYVSGQARDACKGIPGRPVDVMIVFDISASAGAGPGSNWEHTVELTQVLMDYLARPVYRSATSAPETSRIGFISSQTGTLGPEPVLLQSLTDDYAILRDRVTGMTPGGDTDLADGLRMAAEELNKASDDRAQAIVLMLHDNTAVDESSRAAVHEVQGRGIPVYLLVNSLNIPPEKRLTQSIGAEMVPNEHVYLDPQPADLHELFIEATEGNSDLAASSIQVIERLTPPELVQVFEVTGPNGRFESGQVAWEVTDIPLNGTVDLYYRLRIAPEASGKVDIASRILWLDCNGYPQNNNSGECIKIEFELTTEPNEVPRATAQVATPVGSTPTPNEGEVGAVSPMREPIGGGLLSGLVGLISGVPVWVRWLLPLLLLLVLLALLWWLMKRRQQSTSGTVSQPNRRPPLPSSSEREARSTPAGQEIRQDWRAPEQVTDRHGRPLRVRVRPKPEDVEQALAQTSSSPLHIRVDEGNQEVGRAELTVEVLEQSDPLTDHVKQWRGAHIHTFTVTKQNRRRGLEMLLLKHIEALAREHGAHEIHGRLDIDDSLPFFEQYGYQIRRTPQAGDKIFKSLEPG